ncbi:hypothetical protein GCM10022206_59540 [Streptomyces chiangmaiensis]
MNDALGGCRVTHVIRAYGGNACLQGGNPVVKGGIVCRIYVGSVVRSYGPDHLNPSLPAFEDFPPRPRNRTQGGERLCGRPSGAEHHHTWGIGEELVRMALDARSGALGGRRENTQTGGTPDANVMSLAYNPGGARRVQQAWQRYSNSPWYGRGARPCVRPAAPACPVRPAACR